MMVGSSKEFIFPILKPKFNHFKKKYFGIITFLLISVTVHGQQNDSLLTILNTASDRATILTTLDALGKRTLRTNAQDAIKYYQEYYRVAGKETTKQAYAYNQIGIAWYYADDIKKSTENYFAALEILSAVEDHELLARINNNIGWNLQKQGDLKSAIEYFLKAESHAAKITNKSFLANTLNNLGVAYKNSDNYTEALNMYNKAYEINQELNNVEGQIFNLGNIGILHLRLGDYDKSKQYLAIMRPLIIQTQDTASMVNYLITSGELSLALNLPQPALDSVQRGLELVSKVGLASQHAKLVFLQYQAYEALGQYEKALGSYIYYAELSDSIYRTGQTEFIQELSAKYNVTEKEKDLQLAQNKNLEQKLYLILISAGLALSLLALSLILRNYRLKRRKNKELNSLNKELKNSYLTIKEQNEEIQVQSEELREAYEEIQVINENLESTVAERTKKLKIHNEKLMKYARMNAHDVRGPIARILGLIQLFAITEPLEQAQYISMIKLSAEELDKVIHEMNKILEEEDFG